MSVIPLVLIPSKILSEYYLLDFLFKLVKTVHGTVDVDGLNSEQFLAIPVYGENSEKKS